MRIEVFMLTGQNNQEKDILRAYYRGILRHFSRMVLEEDVDDINLESKVKELKKHEIEINLNYGEKVSEHCDVGVVFGSNKPRDNLHHRVRNEVIKVAKNYIMIETPLLGRTIVKMSNHDYYRIGLNGFLYNQGEFNCDNADNKRIGSYGERYNWKGWKQNKDGNILILLQLPGDASLRESDHGEWLIYTLEEIRSKTDRAITIRFHPAMSEKGHENFFASIGKIVFSNYKNITWSDGIETSLEDDLRTAKVCVTYSSGSAIDSIIHGVPVITIDEGNFAYPISSKTLESIDDPYCATKDEVNQWLNKLSYCQWNRPEMAKGIAFGQLYPKIKELIEE